jgi:hypothetical protein
MFSKDSSRLVPGLKVALLSGAMGIALVGCGNVVDGDPAALPPTADMMSADGPEVVGAPAPTAPGHPDRGTVGGGPGTGAWQSDEQTAATGSATGDLRDDPEGVGAPTVGADGQPTTPGGVATADDTTVVTPGAPTVGADGQATTPGGVGTDDDADGDQAGAADTATGTAGAGGS